MAVKKFFFIEARKRSVATKIEGERGKALVVRPLKKGLFAKDL